ncbi:unnamed protein product [Camellia sinensis]
MGFASGSTDNTVSLAATFDNNLWSPERGPTDLDAACGDERFGLRLEDWESLLSESSQNQSLLRWIASEVDDGSFNLKQLLQSSNPNEFDDNFILAIIDQSSGLKNDNNSVKILGPNNVNLQIPNLGYSLSNLLQQYQDDKPRHNHLEYVSTQGSQVFKSKDELLNWVREVGKRNGLVIVIKTSDYGGGKKRPRMYLACERSGQYRATKKLKHDGNNTSRITGTKKCGCPFDMRAHRFTTYDEWTLTVVCGLHNHPPAEHLEGHSYAGRLSKDEKALLMDMSTSMVRPKEILVTLKQRDALNVSTLKTIYNVRHRNRVVQRAGRSQMQHLLGELAKYNYIERHRSEESTMTVIDLFWAHPTSLDLFRSFPRILIMDCTYKTNRYRLPLLEIVGVTSTEMTFSVAFAYLQYERVDNYAWVLATLRDVMDRFVVPTVIVTDRELALMNAIQKIFPSARHLLCRWHISKNVLTKCKKMFETQQKWDKFNHEWNSVVYSSSEIQYEERLKSLLKEFSSYPDAVKYVMDTWLVPYKDKFVAAWTDTCMHCGNVTTNR